MRTLLRLAATVAFAWFFAYQPQSGSAPVTVIGPFTSAQQCARAASQALENNGRIIVPCWQGSDRA